MRVTRTYNVQNCRQCPYSSNTSQEHNCPFTPTPYPTIWFCNYNTNTREHINIRDENVIPDNCPIKEGV
jgi:hypothetical protein